MTDTVTSSSSSRGGPDESAIAAEKEAFEHLTLGILFTTMLIFLGGTFFMTQRKRIPLPYTVVLFLYGILVGAVAKLLAPDVAVALGGIPPELLFCIFLPVLIFEGSFAINIHALRRVFWQTFLLATVGILLNTALLGLAVKAIYTDWSWYVALLLGSLLSATDPVAVVSLLKGLRVDKHITAMVDGESVMNDGTAIIVFTLLLPAAKVGHLTDPWWLVVLNCIRLSVLPVVIGPAFGFVQSFWLRRAKDDLTKACVTVSVTYVSYYVAAHWIGTSGVLTLFFQGVFLSFNYPSLFPGIEGGNLISSTWEFLVHLGNTLLFSLVGVILVADVVPTLEAMDIFIILALYIAMMLARLIMLEVLLPVLNRFPRKLDHRKVLLLVHAGLRGGVAATLALGVVQGGLKEGIPILKVTSGIVLLTLLINAPSAAYVVRVLGFKSKEEFRVQQVQHAMDHLYNTEEKALERVKRDTKYRNANWVSVEGYVNKWLRNPFTGMEILPDLSDDTMVNRLLMTAFKTALWRQRDERVVSETVVQRLSLVLSDKIENGELFYLRETELYHQVGGGSFAYADPHSPVTTTTTAAAAAGGGGGAKGFTTALAATTSATTGPHMSSSQFNKHQQPPGNPKHHRSSDVTIVSAHTSSAAASLNATAAASSALSTPSPSATTKIPNVGSGSSITISGGAGAHPPYAAQAKPRRTPLTTPHSRSLPAQPIVVVDFNRDAAMEKREADMAREELLMDEEELLDRPTTATTTAIGGSHACSSQRLSPLPSYSNIETGEENEPPIPFGGLDGLDGTSSLTAASADAVLPASSFFTGDTTKTAILPDTEGSPTTAAATSTTFEDTDAMVEALMSRLLPAWVVLAERCVFGKGYFISAHRRAQENAFMTLLAIVKCLTAVSTVKYQYVKTPEQARRVERWLAREIADGNAAIRFFYNNFPEATNTVSSSRAVISVVNELHETVERLHSEHGVGMRVKELLEAMTDDIRENIPEQWENDTSKKQSDLVTQAVAATILGKGLRKAEISAIATMGLIKTYSEYDVITLPENAFLIVVFGSLRALHSRWTTIGEHQWSESFGDTVGLESLLLPPELAKDRQRQWRVISTEATVLLISFNSIKPFLSERSLRSVKALWRAAAVEVVIPFLEDMTAERSTKTEHSREHLTGLVAQGTPLIGSEDCMRFDYSSQFHLCFYLRGKDESGLFNRHSPPGYISALYANQLVWRDPNVVLYVVPMNISDSGYVPWNLRTGPNAAVKGSVAAGGTGGASSPSSSSSANRIRRGGGLSGSSTPSSAAAVPIADVATGAEMNNVDAAAAASTTYADAVDIMNTILQGEIPSEIARARRHLAHGGHVDLHQSHQSVIASMDMGTSYQTDINNNNDNDRLGASRGDADGANLSRIVSDALIPIPSTLRSNRAASATVRDEDTTGAATSTVSILQRLNDFVTPVPYVNQLFAQYATHLELLCMAALRYMRYPGDELHARHAQHRAECTLEFLLSFAVELSLLRRAVKKLTRTHLATAAAPPLPARASPADLHALDGGSGEEVDATFQCRVCAWSRQAASTRKYHLKTLILEMSNFANRRFGRYVATLTQAVVWQPQLKEVESVEGLQKLLLSLSS